MAGILRRTGSGTPSDLPPHVRKPSDAHAKGPRIIPAGPLQDYTNTRRLCYRLAKGARGTHNGEDATCYGVAVREGAETVNWVVIAEE